MNKNKLFIFDTKNQKLAIDPSEIIFLHLKPTSGILHIGFKGGASLEVNNGEKVFIELQSYLFLEDNSVEGIPVYE